MKYQVSQRFKVAGSLTPFWSATLQLWTKRILMTRSREPYCGIRVTRWHGPKHKGVYWRNGSQRPPARTRSRRTPLLLISVTQSLVSQAVWLISRPRLATMKTGLGKWTLLLRPMYITSMRWWGLLEVSKWQPRRTFRGDWTSISRTWGTVMSPSSPRSRRMTELCYSARHQDDWSLGTRVCAKTYGSQCPKRNKPKCSTASKSCTSHGTAISTRTRRRPDSTQNRSKTVSPVCSFPR